MINGQEFVGILNATNEILFNLGPDSEYWSPVSYTHLLELMETFAFCMGKLFRMLITWICKLPCLLYTSYALYE